MRLDPGLDGPPGVAGGPFSRPERAYASRILREGVRSLLEQQPDIRIVGEAGDGRATVRLAKELRPHVVVIDMGMSGLNGIEATRQIREVLPGTRVLALVAILLSQRVTGA